MNKLFKRFIAYTIDMMVILVVAQSLSGIPLINKQLNNYNKYYKEYYNAVEDYIYFKDYLHSDLDKELTEEEYNSWLEQCPDYKEIIDKRYEKKTITEKEYNKLAKETDNIYNEISKKKAYKVEQNNILYLIIYLIATIAYFIGFNKYTNGQTLGKKLMRLKIVNSSDKNKDVPIWSYIVRMIILYQPIYYLVKLIGINYLDIDNYYNVISTISTIQSYIEMLVIILVMVRIDGRGIHDILAKTRVIAYDRHGNEIEDKFEIMAKSIKDKRIIDEEVLDDENTSKERTIKKDKSNKKTKSKKLIDEEPTEK